MCWVFSRDVAGVLCEVMGLGREERPEGLIVGFSLFDVDAFTGTQ